jgi:hypothetical protein
MAVRSVPLRVAEESGRLCHYGSQYGGQREPRSDAFLGS